MPSLENRKLCIRSLEAVQNKWEVAPVSAQGCFINICLVLKSAFYTKVLLNLAQSFTTTISGVFKGCWFELSALYTALTKETTLLINYRSY